MGNALPLSSHVAIEQGCDDRTRYGFSDPRSPYAPSTTTSIPNNTSATANEPQDQYASSSGMFAGLLVDIVNHEKLKLSNVRRIALIESILAVVAQEASNEKDLLGGCHQVLTEIVTLGILSSPTLSSHQKDFFLQQGVLLQRWDRIMTDLNLCQQDSTTVVTRFQNNDFLNYRRMILCILRTSRKLHPRSPSSSSSHCTLDDGNNTTTDATANEGSSTTSTTWNRLKAMIVQTKNRTELDDLLTRILERTCPPEMKQLICQGMASGRYDRFLLPDRFDCNEGAEGSVVVLNEAEQLNQKYLTLLLPNNLLFKCILISNVGLTEKDDDESTEVVCAICLDSIHTPAVQLQCDHIFCSRCFGDWMNQSSANAHPDGKATSSTDEKDCHCPMCRLPLLP